MAWFEGFVEAVAQEVAQLAKTAWFAFAVVCFLEWHLFLQSLVQVLKRILKRFYLATASKRFEHTGMDISTFQPIDIKTLTMQDLQPLQAALDPDLSEKQRELVETVFIGLINSAAAQFCEPDVLAQAAMAAVFQMGHSLGGQAYYVAKIENLRHAKKVRAIHASFNGRNHAQLAAAHGISEMRVRQILAAKRSKK